MPAGGCPPAGIETNQPMTIIEFCIYLILLGINAYRGCWSGVAVVLVPMLYRLFKRSPYTRCTAWVLLIMLLVVAIVTTVVVTTWPSPRSLPG